MKQAVFFLALAACAAQAHAQDEAAREARTQRGGTYTEPPSRVAPEFVPQGPDQPGDAGGGGQTLQLRLTVDFPLRTVARAGSGTQGALAGSPTLQAWLRWSPLEDRRWFVQAGFFKYLRAARQQPWNPDFVYSFGFEDETDGGWSFLYSNWTGTRFSPGPGEHRFNGNQGTYTVRYRFDLPEPLKPTLLVGDGDSAMCNVEGNLMPRYTSATGVDARNKVSLGLGCRYQRPEGWFAHFTGYAWERSQQQPWDPDFVYGFGRSEGPWSVQYGNYSGNRWPGRNRAAGEGRLDSGSVSVTWGTGW